MSLDDELQDERYKRKNKDWSNYKTIEDWKNEFESHTDWLGYSTSDMQRKGDVNARRFYIAFKDWIKTTAETEDEINKLREMVFPKQLNNWSNYQTIDDWLDEFNKHSEWAGYSTADMGTDTEFGANAFIQAFRRWINKNAKIEEERTKFKEMIFPRKHKDWSGYTTIEDWINEFNKHPEWEGYSTKDMHNTSSPGTSAYYAAFSNWLKDNTDTKKERTKLREMIFPKKENSWIKYKTIDDWKEEFDKHPEWGGLGRNKMFNDRTSGAGVFYEAFCRWTKNVGKTENEVNDLREIIFPKLLKDWTGYTNSEDWVNEFNKHSEWEGYSTADMVNDKKSGACSFYVAFTEWNRKNTETNEERKKIKELIFPNKCGNDRSVYKTIEDWNEEFNRHPEWEGYSTADMNNDVSSGAYAFYGSFLRWLRKNTKTKEERIKLKEIIFPRKHKDWSSYNTLDNWKTEFDRHPEWWGYSPRDMTLDIVSGANSFYAAFNNWTKVVSNSNKERNELKEIIFPSKNSTYYFGDSKVKFDSNEERIVAILLDMYGLLDLENIHVRTNGCKQHSIDFLFEDNFIEYHPLGILDRKSGRTLDESGKRKLENITNENYFGNNFFHIWEIEQLFDVLSGELKPTIVPGAEKEVKSLKKLMNPEYQNITKEDFKKHLKEARQKIWAYDQKIRTLDNVVPDKQNSSAS